MRLTRFTRALPGGLMLAIGLVSCVSISVRPPAPADLDRVKDGQLTVVLFQIKTMIDGETVSPLDASDPNKSLRMYLANLSDHEAPKRVVKTSPSEPAGREGWLHMLLPPGTYFLLILPPGVAQNPPAVAFHGPSGKFGRLTQYKFESGRGAFWSLELGGYVFSGTPPSDFRELPGFWFQVPEGKPIVYLGTLSIECTSGRGLFGDLIDSCSDYNVTIDLQGAQRVAEAALPGLGGVAAEPLAVYGKVRDGVPLRERGSINLAMAPSAALAGAHTGAQLAPLGLIQPVGLPLGVQRGIVVYDLILIMGRLATRAVAQREAEDRAVELEPCLEQLSRTLLTIDFVSQFTSALKEAAGMRGMVLDLDGKREPTAPGRGRLMRYQVRLTVPILRLRESGLPQRLALELGVHVRLEDIDSKSVAYESLLLYGDSFPLQNPLEQGSRLYERLVPEQAQPRPLSEWCGTNSAVLLREEIGIGVKHVAAQLVQDLE